MTREQFLEKLGALFEEYERKANTVVGGTILFDALTALVEYAWDGEKFSPVHEVLKGV